MQRLSVNTSPKTLRKALCSSLLAGSVLVLSACGGGGGSSNGGSANSAPVFTSGTTASVLENSTATSYTATATDSDGDTLTFSISGGDDQALFNIDTISGEVAFLSAPDFEAPSDANTDNTYEIAVSVSDGSDSTAQNVSISVDNDTTVPTAEIIFPTPVSLTEGDTLTVRGTATVTDVQSTISSVSVLVGSVYYSATSSDGFATWSADINLVAGENTLTVVTEDSEGNENTSADTAMIKQGNDATFPAGDVVFKDLRGLVIDTDNQRLFVAERSLDAVLIVDLNTGERSVFSDDNTPNALVPFGAPQGVVLDVTNNRLLVGDAGRKALLAVSLDDGSRTLISDNTTPDAVNPFSSPGYITMVEDRVFILDVTTDQVLEVDLTTGARTVVSDSNNGIPNSDVPFSFPDYIAWDSDNDRLLVHDGGLNAVLAVDLSEGTFGERTVLSDDTTPDGLNPLTNGYTLMVDQANNRALLSDTSSVSELFAVDLSTGARTILSDSTTPNTFNLFEDSDGIASDGELVYVTDDTAIIVVDLVTGHRVILSRAPEIK